MNGIDDRTVLMTEGLTAGYADGAVKSRVIVDAYLTLCRGEVTCLLGANGAGKSTLLRTLGGQQPPLSGRVVIGGRDSGKLSRRERATVMSVDYTERTHAGALTLTEMVALGRQPYTGFFGRLGEADRDVVRASIEAVGVSSLADRFMATLSDGERQKAMIARALAQETPIMLLDEPTSFLDVASRLEVMALLGRLARERDKAVLLSTHDVANALAVASRLWLVLPGGKVISGAKAEIVAAGWMDRVFAGRDIEFDRDALDYRLITQMNHSE